MNFPAGKLGGLTMPVVYEPMQPFDEGASRAAGGAEMFARLAPTIQRADEARAASYQRQVEASNQMANAQADRASRSANLVYQTEAEANQQNANRLLAAQTANARMQHEANLQGANAAVEENNLRLRAEAQVQLQQAELSHRDQTELSRMKLAVSQIASSPNYTPQEKEDLTTQLLTRINPMEQRRARAAAIQEEIQNKQMQQQLAQADLIQSQRAEFMAGRLKATEHVITDDEGNAVSKITLIPGDKPVVTDLSKANTAANRAAASEAKHQERVDDYYRKRAEYATNTRQKIANDFDKWAAENPTRTEAIKAREGNIKEEFDAAMKVYDQYNKPPQREGQLPRGEVADPNQKPFKREDPDTQTVQQRKTLADVRDNVAFIGRARLSPQLEYSANQAADFVVSSLEKFGSADNMRAKDPLAFAKFDEAMKRLSAVRFMADKAFDPTGKGPYDPNRKPQYVPSDFGTLN